MVSDLVGEKKSKKNKKKNTFSNANTTAAPSAEMVAEKRVNNVMAESAVTMNVDSESQAASAAVRVCALLVMWS